MARLKHFTKDIKVDIRMDSLSQATTTFGAKAGVVFEVPEGYVKYFTKTLGCTVVTPQSEAPKPVQPKAEVAPTPAPAAPAVAAAPVKEDAPAAPAPAEAPAAAPAAKPEAKAEAKPAVKVMGKVEVKK